MPMVRTIAVLALLAPALPAVSAETADGYSARLVVTDDGDTVASSSVYAAPGEPVRMSMTHNSRYGGADGPMVRTGFDFELRPRPVGDAMMVDVRLNRFEVTDPATGALREELSVLQGEAKRTPEGWVYENDGVAGGKVLKVSFARDYHPEWAFGGSKP